MKKIVPFFIITAIVLGACSGSGDEKKAKDKYEQTKESLEVTEKKNPLRFLAVDGRDRKNLLGQTVIKGSISNKATAASYKDVDIEISFYSKTGALLLRDHHMVYEIIAPGENRDFKTKIRAPKDTDSVNMKIVRAKSK